MRRTSLEVVEYLEHTRPFLDAALPLKPGGSVFVTVPR